MKKEKININWDDWDIEENPNENTDSLYIDLNSSWVSVYSDIPIYTYVCDYWDNYS